MGGSACRRKQACRNNGVDLHKPAITILDLGLQYKIFDSKTDFAAQIGFNEQTIGRWRREIGAAEQSQIKPDTLRKFSTFLQTLPVDLPIQGRPFTRRAAAQTGGGELVIQLLGCPSDKLNKLWILHLKMVHAKSASQKNRYKASLESHHMSSRRRPGSRL